jgi:hypothetical protein
MSRENVELVQRAYKAFDDAGFSGAAGLDFGAFDEDIEVDTSKRPVDADVFRGHDGLREFLSLQRGIGSAGASNRRSSSRSTRTESSWRRG